MLYDSGVDTMTRNINFNNYLSVYNEHKKVLLF